MPQAFSGPSLVVDLGGQTLGKLVLQVGALWWGERHSTVKDVVEPVPRGGQKEVVPNMTYKMARNFFVRNSARDLNPFSCCFGKYMYMYIVTENTCTCNRGFCCSSGSNMAGAHGSKIEGRRQLRHKVSCPNM